MARLVSATLVGTPIFEYGGAWLPLQLRIGSCESRIGVYLRRDVPRRMISDLEEYGLSRSERERVNREVLIELDCDLAERTEFTFYLAGAVYSAMKLASEREGRAYEALVSEAKRELGVAAFHVPSGSGIGIAVFHETPSRECLRLLARRIYGVPYLNVFERRNVKWPRFLRYPPPDESVHQIEPES